MSPTYDTKRFEVHHFGHALTFPWLANAEASICWDRVAGTMVAQVEAFMLSGDRRETVVKSSKLVPATWWDHFKHDCMPAWFTRRWPPKTTSIATSTTVSVQRFCPHIKLPSGARDHITFLVEQDDPAEFKGVQP